MSRHEPEIYHPLGGRTLPPHLRFRSLAYLLARLLTQFTLTEYFKSRIGAARSGLGLKSKPTLAPTQRAYTIQLYH